MGNHIHKKELNIYLDLGGGAIGGNITGTFGERNQKRNTHRRDCGFINRGGIENC